MEVKKNNTTMKGGSPRGLGSGLRPSVPSLNGVLPVTEIREFKLVRMYIDTLSFVVREAQKNFCHEVLGHDLFVGLQKVRDSISELDSLYAHSLQLGIYKEYHEGDIF